MCSQEEDEEGVERLTARHTRAFLCRTRSRRHDADRRQQRDKDQSPPKKPHLLLFFQFLHLLFFFCLSHSAALFLFVFVQSCCCHLLLWYNPHVCVSQICLCVCVFSFLQQEICLTADQSQLSYSWSPHVQVTQTDHQTTRAFPRPHPESSRRPDFPEYRQQSEICSCSFCPTRLTNKVYWGQQRRESQHVIFQLTQEKYVNVVWRKRVKGERILGEWVLILKWCLQTEGDSVSLSNFLFVPDVNKQVSCLWDTLIHRVLYCCCQDDKNTQIQTRK